VRPANRLSGRSMTRVVLVRGRPSRHSLLISTQRPWGALMSHRRLNWNFSTTPQEGLIDRRSRWPARQKRSSWITDVPSGMEHPFSPSVLRCRATGAAVKKALLGVVLNSNSGGRWLMRAPTAAGVLIRGEVSGGPALPGRRVSWDHHERPVRQDATGVPAPMIRKSRRWESRYQRVISSFA